MKKKQYVFLVVLVLLLLMAILGSAFAYFESNIDIENANLETGMVTGSSGIFTAYSEKDIVLDINKDLMKGNSSNTNAIASANTMVHVNLDGGSGASSTTCEYDLIWVWDSTDQYKESSVSLPYTHTDGTVYPYEFSVKVGLMETNLSGFTWEGDKAIIATKTITAPSREVKTDDFMVEINIYNLPINQSILDKKVYQGHLEISEGRCSAVKADFAYCKESNISSFSECLIRSDSNNNLKEANKIIDARTSLMDLNYTEPAKLYTIETTEVNNISINNTLLSYLEIGKLPFQDEDLTGDTNLSFNKKRGQFEVSWANVKKGSIEEVITTEEDINNGVYKVVDLNYAMDPFMDKHIIYSYDINSQKGLGLKFKIKETGTMSSTPGLYKVPDKYTNGNENLSYMYRGDVIKNWVKFGTETVWVGYNNENGEGEPREYKTENLCNNSTSGYKYNCTPIEADIYWRIIRINGNGSVRMIYSGNNLEEKLENITASHTEKTYTGILTNYDKKGNSRASDYFMDETQTGRNMSYVGYMHNSNTEFMIVPNLELKNPDNNSSITLDEFSLHNPRDSVYFNNFNIEENCDKKAGICTLTCTNYNEATAKGDNCIYATWNDLTSESNLMLDEAYGSTLKSYYYNGDYKYTCMGTLDKIGNNLVAKCSLVEEILGVPVTNNVVSNSQAIVKKYGFFSPSKEEADENLVDSKAKTEIDEWYRLNFVDKVDNNNNLIIEYIADEGFCNDRSVLTGDGYSTKINYSINSRINKNNASLICLRPEIDEFTTKTSADGNKALIYPIGMITGDELLFAGGKHRTQNVQAYYNSEIAFWTMTPFSFDLYYDSEAFIVISNSNYVYQSAAKWPYSIRPVINLSKDVLYASGSCLKNDPYTVKLNS